jgi:hypothetical protein
MDGNSTASCFAYVKESSNDLITRSAAVNKDEVMMVKAGINEPLRLVQPIIQPDHTRHAAFTEVGKIRLRGVKCIS